MASTTYTLSKDHSFQANGRYPKGLEGEDPKDPRPAIRRLLELFREIQGLHQKFTAGDGQIVGVERSRLLGQVDAVIMTTVLLIRRHTDDGLVDLFPTDEPGPRFVLDLDSDGWNMQGNLPLRLASFQGTFPDFYRMEFSPPLKAFLEGYKAAATDGTVTQAEGAELLPRLRDILLVSLRLYFLLYYMKINS